MPIPRTQLRRRSCGPRTRARRGARVAGLLVATVLVAAACLPPGAPDPTGTAPVGHLDSLVGVEGGFRATGWAYDPDTREPVPVSLSTEGRVILGGANRPRPDVAAATGAHPNTGFDIFYAQRPGRFQVCAWVDNVGRGTQGRLLGCTDLDVPAPVSPRANWDLAEGRADGTVRVAGWATDPDAPGPVTVLVRINNLFAAREPASQPRPDVVAVAGDLRRGFDWTLPQSSGPRWVCLTALNRGAGRDTDLGCRLVDVPAPPADRRPVGAVTALLPSSGAVEVEGVAADPDGGAGLRARIEVAGGPSATVDVTAGSFRRVLSGVPAGARRVCVTLLDVGGPPPPGALGGDRPLPCGTAVLGGPLSIATGGAPSSLVGVGPPPGSPLGLIDRDAGVSARLRDGSTLWFFADSSEVDGAGLLRYFVNNTAAWAAPGAPAVTRDAVAPGARPVQFVAPGPGFPACPPSRPKPAQWPTAAVVTPDGARDAVTVFLADVCLGSGFLEIEPRGISVARYTYDPAAPPVGVPVQGTIVAQSLFGPGEPEYGTAAVLGDDGLIHAHDCQGPAEGGFPDAYGPCTVARVAPAAVGDRSAWQYWNGATWVADRAAAAALALPDGVDGPSVPVASFTVVRDPALDAFVMAYSPWPGFTDRVAVRVAERPEGPWTAPVEVFLAGCAERIAGVDRFCYAGGPQPAFSAGGVLGLGYYDQLVDVPNSRGQYRALQVPFALARS